MGNEISCFLIDNDIDDQEVFDMALKEANNHVHCIVSNSGSDAVKKLSSDPDFIPSFIFIDLYMPLMDGKECLQEIRKMPHLDHVPIYMYSTFADDNTIRELKRTGATDYIKKPNAYKALVDLLSNILQTLKIAS
jgi:CheY-like chemotaxis protein